MVKFVLTSHFHKKREPPEVSFSLCNSHDGAIYKLSELFGSEMA